MNHVPPLVILQARMGSARLPRKTLATLSGTSVLWRCLRRLQVGAPVLVATTSLREDDPIEVEAIQCGARVFRGPERDVLLRYVLAAESAGARCVVRATADNPAVDMDAIDRVVGRLTSGGFDYVFERGLPYGAAVEAVTLEALKRSEHLTTEPGDREHVTTFVRRSGTLFKICALEAPVELSRPDVRLTIDTREDLEYMRDLFARLGNPAGEPPLASVIAAADSLAEAVSMIPVASSTRGASLRPVYRLPRVGGAR